MKVPNTKNKTKQKQHKTEKGGIAGEVEEIGAHLFCGMNITWIKTSHSEIQICSDFYPK